MKIIIVFIACCSLTLMSLTENVPQPAVTGKTLQEVINMRIRGEVDCEGTAGNTKCLKVQKGASIGKEEWETLPGPIEGFRYEEGYTYDVTVRIDALPDTGDGAAGFRYTLVNVLSKVKS